MSANWGYNGTGKSFSYQHMHGIMLVNLNALSRELNLKHPEYRLMGTLIGLWNKEQGKAFPTIEYLSKICHMGKATVIKTLNKLVDLNLLVVVKTKGKRNNYYFSNLLLEPRSSSPKKPSRGFTCETLHEEKQIKKKTEKILTSCNKTKPDKPIITRIINDPYSKPSSLTEYRKVIEKLESWSFAGAKKAIKTYGVKKIQALIQIVEKNNPGNSGAYLRTLLELPDEIIQSNDKNKSINAEPTLIQVMLQYKYWKHKNNNKIYQVKPDVGSHLLIRYDPKTESVCFIDNNYTDKLEKFEPSTEEAFQMQNKDQSKKKPSKKQVLKDMMAKGDVAEAKALARLWKIKL